MCGRLVLSCSLCCAARPPFWSEDDDEVFDQILAGDYNFDAPVWRNISSSAKDLIRKMMTVDPKQRITAAKALQHPWILSEAPEHVLSDTVENLAKFNARRKWKGAILATMAANRMKNVKTKALKANTDKRRNK
jgi:calcium-dependent protein kinase